MERAETVFVLMKQTNFTISGNGPLIYFTLEPDELKLATPAKKARNNQLLRVMVSKTAMNLRSRKMR